MFLTQTFNQSRKLSNTQECALPFRRANNDWYPQFLCRLKYGFQQHPIRYVEVIDGHSLALCHFQYVPQLMHDLPRSF